MPNWQNAVLTVDRNTSGTGFVDATGLSFTALASTQYEIRWRLIHQSVLASTGIKLSLNGPAGFSVFLLDRFYMISLSAIVGQLSRGFDIGAASSQVDLANNDVLSHGEAILVNGVTAGTVIVRFGSEVNLSQVSIMTSSLLQYRVVP